MSIRAAPPYPSDGKSDDEKADARVEYLNIIEWGPGMFGIEAAQRLTMEEDARLAGVIPSPLRHQPTETTSYVEKK